MKHNHALDINIDNIRTAQSFAKKCLDELPAYLRPGMTREEIHRICEDLMLASGSTGWWIRNDPALILFGPHTTFSAHESPDPLFKGLTVQENDVITVDVAPMFMGGWGDMARTFVMEKGRIIPWNETENDEIRSGLMLEEQLHADFRKEFTPAMTFADLHAMTEEILLEKGYRNCDYHGNFGHTIETHPDRRVTIIPEETRVIAEYGKPITFEPHICRIGGTIGVKYENMYFWHDGELELFP